MALPCMILEAVADNLCPEGDHVFQLKELEAFGDVRAQKIGASGVSNDFVVGFELARRGCRLELRTSPVAVLAGIDADRMF